MLNYQGDVYGQFHLAMPIQKTASVTENGETKMVIAGVASGMSTDLESDRMTEAAIHAFKKAVEHGIVDKDGVHSLIPLRTGHRQEWNDVLGWVTKATVDSDNNLWIEAELDETSSIAMDLFRKLQVGSRPGKPLKLGFSVGGLITKARQEFDQLTKRVVRVIEDVLLDEISVVGAPAFAPSFLDVLHKSIRWDDVPTYYQQGEDSMNLLTAVEDAKRIAREELAAQGVSLNKANEQSVAVTEPVTVPDAAVGVAVQNGEEVLVPQDNSNNVAVANTQVADDNVNTDTVIATEAAAAAVDPVADEEAAREAAAAQAKANAQVNNEGIVGTQEGALKELQDQVRALADSVAQLLQQQSGAATGPTEKSVSSNATTEAEVLTKSTDEVVAEAVTNALVAFKTEFLDPMTAELKKMTEKVDEIAATPMNKSLAVEAATPRTTVEEFRKRLTEQGGNGLNVSPIRASIAASLARE